VKASSFIAGRLRFEGRLAMVSIALSFLVMILAVTISTGFRREIRAAASSVSGDIQLSSRSADYASEDDPVPSKPSYLGDVLAVNGVNDCEPVVYRAGIIKSGETIHGVMFKGTEADTTSMSVRVPSRLADILGLAVGDKMTTYFVGERVKLRRFTVAEIYDAVLDSDAALTVFAPISDMRRLNGWSEDEASVLEISLDHKYRSAAAMTDKRSEIGAMVTNYAQGSEEELVCSSVIERYPQLFGWLDLLDFNVLILLILMTLVAGFNMISGLLILLFRHISTIGILKAMGMDSKGISSVFLKMSSNLVLKGMAIGNALALLFCAVQGATHLIRLNPENYFISFVPVSVNLPFIVLADLVAYCIIMLLLLIPCRFISTVDPAKTIKTN